MAENAGRPDSTGGTGSMGGTGADRIHQILRTGVVLRERNPLIHCITSPIAINDCANAVLAVGARPICAEHPAEVRGITAISASLGVTLANITDARAESLMLSGDEALKRGLRSVIDAVGVNCSPFRMELAKRFVKECRPAVIKGNLSEIRALAGASFGNQGIDTADEDQVRSDRPGSLEKTAEILKDLARRSGAVILASGITDVLTDGTETIAVSNGVSDMARVTGTGCILNCLTAAFLSAAETPLDAAACAVLLLGIAGETALPERKKGLGSYHVALIDAISSLDAGQLKKKAKIRFL